MCFCYLTVCTLFYILGVWLGREAKIRKVSAGEGGEPSKMGGRPFGRYGNHRHFQTSADNFSNVAHRHALFGHGVIPRAFNQLLERQPVETSRIENVHRRPAVASITHIGGYTLLASELNRIRD